MLYEGTLMGVLAAVALCIASGAMVAIFFMYRSRGLNLAKERRARGEAVKPERWPLRITLIVVIAVLLGFFLYFRSSGVIG